jgi:glycosyltransferase involved in cell wall biosynthesis
MKNPKPTILIVTELLPSEEIVFLGSFVFFQIRELAKKYRIVVIVPVSFKSKIKQKFVHDGDLDIYYIKDYSLAVLAAMYRLGFYGFDTLMFLKKKLLQKRIVGFAKRIDRKYDFSLVHGHEAFIGDEAVAVGRKLGIPSIITIHGLYDYHEQLFGNKAMRHILKNLNGADKIISVSKMAADSYRNRGVENNFQIIPNGIDIDARSESFLPEILRQKLIGKTVILSVGFFIAPKRIDQLLYAFSELKGKYKDIVLLLIGMGHQENLYKEIIKNNGMEDQVYILGQISPSEMVSYYRAADFIVHPSVSESFSMVCLEAMAAGKPFICTSNIGITEYVTDGKEAFIIPPDSIGSLTEKMDLLLRDPELRKAMGRAARETSRAFRWENVLLEISSVYDSFLNKPRRS